MQVRTQISPKIKMKKYLKEKYKFDDDGIIISAEEVMEEILLERKRIIDYIKNCPGNYYGDKVFTPGEYHYYVVDKKKLQAVLNAKKGVTNE